MSNYSSTGDKFSWKYVITACVFTLAIILGFMRVSPAATSSMIKSSDDGEETTIDTDNGYVTYLPALFWPRTQNIVGMQMGCISPGCGLNKIADTNTYWVGGIPVLWSDIESTQGVYDWTIADNHAVQWANASNKGLTIIGNVRSTPSWARLYSKYFCGPMQSQYFDEFADFMYRVVSRYSVPPYNVRYWEIWNEPDVAPSQVGDNYDNQFGCWGNTNDSYYGGGYYANMLKAVYPAMKNANPQVQVLVGGLLMNCDPNKSSSCKETKFFEGILRGGGGPYFDGVSFHAYDYYSYTWGTSYEGNLGKYQNNVNWSSQWNTTGPVLIEKTNYLNSLLANYGVTGKYLMNTEVALNCRICTGEVVPGYNENPTPAFETTKAYYITQAYASAIHVGLRANLWYRLLGWPEQNTELLDSNLTEHEGFIAYRVAGRKLAGASSLGEISGSDISPSSGIKGYKFLYKNREIWVVWSLDGKNHNVTLTSNRTLAGITDALGNEEPLSTSMTITIKPVYIEWTP